MAADKKAETSVPKDPITQGSLLWPTLWAVVALLVSGAYSLVDEGWVRRPYRRFQAEGLPIVREGLQAKLAAAKAEIARVKEGDTYRALDEAHERARLAAQPKIDALNAELNDRIMPALLGIGETVKIRRSLVTAATYSYNAAHGAAKKRAKGHLDALVSKKEKVRWFDEEVEWDWNEMHKVFTDLKARQAAIQGELGHLNAPVSAARKARNKYLAEHLRLPDPKNINKLIASLDDYEIDIKQIHLTGPDGEVVERCESCHIAVRYPMELEPEEVKGRVVYASHPRPELLAVHDPETFGCSPCHNGNGIAVESVDMAHGYYTHWLWPLHRPENYQAGCIQCHSNDFVLAEGQGLADHFNRGRFLFKWRGCTACHKYEGLDRELNHQIELDKRIASVEQSLGELEIALAEQRRIAGESEDDDEIEAATQAVRSLREQRHLLRGELDGARERRADVEYDEKRVGPNLKEIKAKLHPEWLHSWIVAQRRFRPDTKMPKFRVSDEEAWDIAAFLWQSAVERDDIPAEPEGDAERGALLVKTRGCLGCHRIYDEEAEEEVGDGFSANLSRMGEKASAAYIKSWVQDPRRHNARTVMPSLRLNDQDATDIATFLGGLKSEDATYPERDTVLPILTDEKRFDAGLKLVRHLGCFRCHEIKGLETEGRIGTELTKEGSKPIERLDFGLLTHEAERSDWYDHKGFFERKLRQPDIWDEGKYLPDRFERLRMPEFWEHLESVEDEDRKLEILQDIDDLTTYLLGSVDSAIPGRMRYQPTGLAKDIQDGWWLIKKYNCDGCHQVVPGKQPNLWDLSWYIDSELEGVPSTNARPPTLVGEGTRVDPDWLMRFLKNPALTEDPAKIHRNGVREGLMIRMPTYELSARERGTLVRFFTALSKLQRDYVRPEGAPLSGKELDTARAAFVAGDCYNCHLLGTETRIVSDTTYAPNFRPVKERIRPGWYHRWITEPATVIPGTAMPALLSPVKQADGSIFWRMDVGRVSSIAKKRLTDREERLIEEYRGDHATLLGRYLSNFNETEAKFLHEKRAIQ